jgi:Uma2 family endonuclease
MSAILSPTEHAVVLRNISWPTYQRLLAERGETANPRYTFDRGLLEIMVLSAEHERAKTAFLLIFELAATELNIDADNTGSNTFQREDLERGFEPDLSFYIKNAAQVRQLTRLDLNIDPAPDLVIEIDVTHSSIDKLALFAATGISEVWRYKNNELSIYLLENGIYRSTEFSVALPGASRIDLSRLVAERLTTSLPAWMQAVRKWAVGLRGRQS